MLSPKLFNVGFDGATDGAEVVKTGTSTIDFTTLEEDEATLDQIIKELLVLVHKLNKIDDTFLPVSSSMLVHSPSNNLCLNKEVNINKTI
jgi:hypothetical protein